MPTSKNPEPAVASPATERSGAARSLPDRPVSLADERSRDERTVLTPAAPMSSPFDQPAAQPAPARPARWSGQTLAASTQAPPARSGPSAAPGDPAAPADAPAAGAPAVVPDANLDTIVGDRYRILRKLGEGGMGTVYLAEHVIIEKRVALKILSEEFARKADLVQRFIQEAKAASKIGHENIVDITDFGETPSGSVFIAMEFLEGRDLATVLRELGALPFERCRAIVTQICRALGAAHAKGIIHRDMKPENVYLVEREGRSDFVKILDFGIAKVSSLDNEGGARLTRTGMIFGTPEYMSPEQARGDRPDHRVDIYAVGCILYEMLTGDVPFHADSFMGVLTRHMFDAPEPPSRRAPERNIPADVEAVVMTALAKDRDRRFQTMKEFSTALAACGGMDAGEGWGNEPSGVYDASSLPRARAESTPAVTPSPGSTGDPAMATGSEAPPRRRGSPVAAAVLIIALFGGGGFGAVRYTKEIRGALQALHAFAANAGLVPAAPPGSAEPANVAPPATTAMPANAALANGAAGHVAPANAAPANAAHANVAPLANAASANAAPLANAAPVNAAPAAAVPVASAPLAAPAKVRLTINSTPPGAGLFRGRDLLGATPATIDLPGDKRSIVLLLKKHDYRDREIEVTPDRDRTYDFDLSAARKSPGRSRGSSEAKASAAASRSSSAAPKAAAGKLRDLKDPFDDKRR